LAPRLAFLGALLSAGLFLMTQSMLRSTPGAIGLSKDVLHRVGGAGQFLPKDAGLFALSLFMADEARAAMRR
jgi:reactive chlorine resistance protein C